MIESFITKVVPFNAERLLKRTPAGTDTIDGAEFAVGVTHTIRTIHRIDK